MALGIGVTSLYIGLANSIFLKQGISPNISYGIYFRPQKWGMAYNVEGLLLRWHSMNFSLERQPNNEPKAEYNYKR